MTPIIQSRFDYLTLKVIFATATQQERIERMAIWKNRKRNAND